MKLYEYTNWPDRQVELIQYEVDDEPLFAATFDQIQPHWTVIDLGASIGYYTVLAAKKASPGLVVAVEPHPLLVETLRRNLELHRLRNVGIVDRAVTGPKAGARVLMTEGAKRGGAEISARRPHLVRQLFATMADTAVFRKLPLRMTPGAAQRNFEAQTCTLDQLVKKLGLEQVDLVKVDIEGAEYEIFEGAGETLERLRPIILIEMHRRSDRSPAELEDFLMAYGYRITKDDRGHTFALRADPVRVAPRALARDSGNYPLGLSDRFAGEPVHSSDGCDLRLTP